MAMKRRERDLIDAARSGSLTATAQGPKTLFKAVDAYLEHQRGHGISARTPTTLLDCAVLSGMFW